jgi:hypothetical protein
MDRLEEDLKNVQRSRSQEDLCGFEERRGSGPHGIEDDWFVDL